MLGAHRESAGAPSQAAAAFLEAGDVARVAICQFESRRVLPLGLSAPQRRGASKRIPISASSVFTTTVTCSRRSGRNEDALNAFREMLTRAYRLDLRGARRRRTRAHRTSLSRPRAARRSQTASRFGAFAFAESEDERGIASTVDDIGKLHWLRGDYHRALEYTERALVMRRQIGDRGRSALSAQQFGKAFTKIRGNFARARVLRAGAPDSPRDWRFGRRAISLNDRPERWRKISTTTIAPCRSYQEAYEVAKGTADRNRSRAGADQPGERFSIESARRKRPFTI